VDGGGVTAARVAVTGGSGFLGRQIEAALTRLGVTPVAPPRVDLLDVTARRAWVSEARADVLVHAAWITRNGMYWEAPENLAWIAATLDLMQAFAAGGGRRFVLVGSCAEYDWSRPSRTPWRERRICRPASLYGAAKLASWIALEAFARESGLSAATARVFVPVGAHEAHGRLLPSLIRALLTGTPMETGPAELTRDFMDVRDAGAAVAHIALADVQGPVNVGSGRGVSLGELVQRVAGASPLIRVSARPPRGREPLWMVADPRRLRRTTRFSPRYSLDDTIADAFAYWRAAA
jgi:nucleoside-diphosphate-sugar epimerase